MHGMSGVRKNKHSGKMKMGKGYHKGGQARKNKNSPPLPGYMHGGVVKKTIKARGGGAATRGTNFTAFPD